jgi:phage terminase small subunit
MAENKLTPKQKRFVAAYIATLNASEAARQAGYSERSAGVIGHENLRKPQIREAIKSVMEEKAMPAEEVAFRLSEIARGSMADFMAIKANGLAFFDFNKAERENKLHLVKRFKIAEGGVELELYDAQAALVQLGRIHQLFVDRTKVSGDPESPFEIDLSERLMQLLSRKDANNGTSDDGTGETTGDTAGE